MFGSSRLLSPDFALVRHLLDIALYPLGLGLFLVFIFDDELILGSLKSRLSSNVYIMSPLPDSAMYDCGLAADESGRIQRAFKHEMESMTKGYMNIL